MALPTITMIDKLMSTGSWAKHKRAIVLSPEIANKTIDINYDSPLPPGWDQFIDMKVGELYYINKKTGKKTTKDPRKFPSDGGYSSCETSDDDDECPSPGFSLPHPPTPELRSLKPSPAKFLILVGCKKCMTYMMVQEGINVCPKCWGPILHFDQGSCF